MKRIISLIITFFIFISVSSACGEEAIQPHNYSSVGNNYEVEKLQWHFERVEAVLREVDTSNLNDKQKQNRLKKLDLLNEYSRLGNFPNNDKFPGKIIPFFRGSNGNLCAVGYLMYADLEYKDFVNEVARTNNNVRVMNIKDNELFDSWLKINGFTKLEMAMVQPTYNYKNQYDYEPTIYDMLYIILFLLIFFVLLLTWRGIWLLVYSKNKLEENKKIIKNKGIKYIKIAFILFIIFIILTFILLYL